MRPSPLRHPVAVLRKIIGLGQKEFGAMCSCSARTIQAVELCDLALSEKLAMRIARATGVNSSWLLNGDAAVPPTAGDLNTARPYTKADFEAWVGGDALPNVPVLWTWLLYQHCARLDAVMASAEKRGKVAIVMHRVGKFTAELEAEFGVVREVRFLHGKNVAKISRAVIGELPNGEGFEQDRADMREVIQACGHAPEAKRTISIALPVRDAQPPKIQTRRKPRK